MASDPKDAVIGGGCVKSTHCASPKTTTYCAPPPRRKYARKSYSCYDCHRWKCCGVRFWVWLLIFIIFVGTYVVIFFWIFNDHHHGHGGVHAGKLSSDRGGHYLYECDDDDDGGYCYTSVYRPYESLYLGLEYCRYAAGHYSADTDPKYPNPRHISNYVMADDDPHPKGSRERCEMNPNDRYMSSWVTQWGQFVDHEIALTFAGSEFGYLNASVKCDKVADPHCKGKTIHLTRSKFKKDGHGQRQQINELTSYLDGSAVYGSTYDRYRKLRLFKFGRLKVSKSNNSKVHGDFMPFNTYGLKNAGGDDRKTLYLGGDIRANEQLGLTATHTLWMREHNWWADSICEAHSDWSDEKVYWAARRIVAAEISKITYYDWLPALLGHAADHHYYNEGYSEYGMPPPKYNSSIDARICNEFATAAYRFGHSSVSESIYLYGYGHDSECLALKEAFFRPSLMVKHGVEPILAGLAHQQAEEIDVVLVDSLRNFLHFGEFFDLAVLNILRGRDHSIPYYHDLRHAVTGHRINSWQDITHDEHLISKLKYVYGDDGWRYLDAWVGILAEDHKSGSSMGITGITILIDQFRRIRDGDPYYWEWDDGLCKEHKARIAKVTLYDIILRNTKLDEHHLPQHKDVFYVDHHDHGYY